MQSKTVWHLISNRWNSAITEYALSSARALEKQGYTSIFSCREGSPAERRARELDLETLPLQSFSLAQLAKIRKMSQSIQPVCALFYGGPETFLGKFIPVKKQIRFLGQDLRTQTSLFSRFFLSYSHLEKIIVPNNILAAQVERNKINKPSRRIILGLESKTSALEEHSPTCDLMILGRIDPIKGHERFIRIFAKMFSKWPRDHSTPVLHIVGESANLSISDVKTFASNASLEIGKNIIFTGERVPHIETLLQQARVGVIPSLGSEHICRVAEEFLLNGVPIFVSGAGATEEVLFPDGGESYKGKSDDEAAEQVLKLILKVRGDSFEKRLNRASYARKAFSLERMGKELEDFIFL